MLAGPGGVGKTRLAEAVVSGFQPAFPDGIAFVALASVRDSKLVPTAIARALGLGPQRGEDPLDTLVRGLEMRSALLVLDNFEHILEASAFVEELLKQCPRIKVLVTSRETLRVYGENTWLVRPLALPDLTDPPPLGEMAEIEAVRLFTDRALAADAEFGLTEENAAAVAAICHRLDGLPLAIELAAARMSMFSPESLLAGLAQRLPLLTGGSTSLPLRLRTMRSAIGWSYDLLSPAEQRLFRHLCVFRGVITPEAAAFMFGGTFEVMEVLASLIDEQLLQKATSGGDTPVFTILETVREFGLEQLHAAAESLDARRSHAERCLMEATWIDEGLNGPDQATRVASFLGNLDNFRAAF